MKGLRRVVAAAIALFLSVAAASAQPAARPPQTDQTVPVSRGARLTMSDVTGEVVIRGWERDAVRVQARHASRTRVSVRAVASGLSISASGSQGPAGSVDYEINVPAWLPVKVDGTFAFITVEAFAGEIAAETVRGDVTVRGGTGVVTCKTIEGEILIEGAKGRVTASSVNNGISISSTSGDISADSTNGTIRLENIQSSNVEVQTVNGQIIYDAKPTDGGRYQFTTHNGNIYVAVPESSSASFIVRTFNGRVDAGLPVQGSGDPRRGRRVTYTLGGGSAEFAVESFGGAIFLRRPGALPASAKTR